MKIALASVPVKTGDIAFNLKMMTDAMEQVSGQAEVILFGESVLQGFDSLCWTYEKDQKMAVALTDEPVRRMCEAAQKNKIAVSFGMIEYTDKTLYSSQVFVGCDGNIANVFHRVSVGWKEYTKTDEHYREGEHFEKFLYHGKTFATALCGDLWTDGRPEEMHALGAEVVLWPVWCDYGAQEWNTSVKFEYAQQAERCGDRVLLVNPICADEKTADCAAGGSVYFEKGKIAAQMPAGVGGVQIIEV